MSTSEPQQTLDTSKAEGALWQALAKAQSAVESVGKDGTNTQRDYKYATTEAMIRGSRRHLADHGLAFVSSWSCEDPRPAAGDIGRQHVAARVMIYWALGHESGVLRGAATMDAIGSPARPPDKAVAAAVTYGLGFVLRGLLLLDRAEEDEHSPDRRPEPKPDPLWDAYVVLQGRVAGHLGIAAQQAHERCCYVAGVQYQGEPNDQQLQAMTAAAHHLLGQPRETKAPRDRERAAASGETVVTADAQALDQWKGAARGYCERREADYLDAECKSPTAKLKKEFQQAALRISCEAIGADQWPKGPTVAQLQAATAALMAAMKPREKTPREHWRVAQNDYIDAKVLDYRKAEGAEPDAGALADFTADTLRISAKALGISKWIAQPSDEQWSKAEQALLAEVARLGGAG